MKRSLHFSIYLLLASLAFHSERLLAQEDTVRVMSYNVLSYGNYCQGSPASQTAFLKNIVSYANPDILGLVKVQSIMVTPTDNNGISPFGYADSIIRFALDPAFPNRYNYCPLTNHAASSDMTVLFYNQQKFTCAGVTTLCSLQVDFNLFKLYYNDINLPSTHDTTFLYVILNHTASGTSTTDRDMQIATTIQSLKTMFYHWPNLIDMGDFNLHNTSEPGYQEEVAAVDTSFRFYDPPFFPDQTLAYPMDWDSNPTLCPSYLSTSTRLNPNVPNTCGTGGGAKDWYDHILLSSWIDNNANYVRYIPKSFRTFGNDGHRTGISVNDSTTNGKNTTAPSEVANSLFYFSNKYPVMVELGITPNTTGQSLVDPNIYTGIEDFERSGNLVKIVNPVLDNLSLLIPEEMNGQTAFLTFYDLCGRLIESDQTLISGTVINEPSVLQAGVYFLKIRVGAYTQALKFIKQ